MRPQEMIQNHPLGASEAKFIKCPQCSAILSTSVSASLSTSTEEHPWCDQCGWGVEIPMEIERHSLFERFHLWFSRKWGDAFHQQMLATPPGTQEYPAVLWLALLLAVVPNGLTLALILWGAWCTVDGPAHSLAVNIFLGLLCWAGAWALLPRFKRLERTKCLPRSEFPALYHLTDRIAAELDTPPVEEIHVSLEFNACALQLGLRKKRVIVLGLPLLALLNGKELVALVGHEMAHFKSAQHNFSALIETAIASLCAWYDVVNPARLCEPELMDGYSMTARFVLWVFSLVCLPVAGLIFAWTYLLALCYWRVCQQAEYLADWRAAQLSGTQAILSLFRRLTQREIYEKELSFSYLSQDGQNFLQHLRKRFDQVTLREEMRVLWVEKLTHSGVAHTHPPTLDRIEYLKKYYCSTAKIGVTPWDETQIQKESLSVFEPLLQQIFQLDQMSFRELFASKGW